VNARAAFTRLIDHAIVYGGSYYLTYHRFARRDQLLTCHPQLADFVSAKRRFDPAGVFQSDWYHHISAQLAGTLG
jgi:FAD/FMN-containing dehydrogenase